MPPRSTLRYFNMFHLALPQSIYIVPISAMKTNKATYVGCDAENQFITESCSVISNPSESYISEGSLPRILLIPLKRKSPPGRVVA